MNRTIVSGYLGQDATVVENSSTPFTSFTVATTERWTNREGVKQERTTWFSCRYSNVKVAAFLKKGSHVLLEGTVSAQGYVSTKTKEAEAELILRVQTIEFLDSKDARTETSAVSETGTV